MAKRVRNMPEHPEQYEESVSQTGLGRMRDWGTGMMSIALAGKAGDLWAVRMVDGSVAVSYVWERHELWYANVVLLEASNGQRTFEVLENLGPYPTQGHASHWSGIQAGRLALKYQNDEADDENSEPNEDDGSAENEDYTEDHSKWWNNGSLQSDEGPMGL